MLASDSNEPYHPDLIYEMSFKKFLYFSASPNIFLFYSTNFRVMESLAEVTNNRITTSPTWEEIDTLSFRHTLLIILILLFCLYSSLMIVLGGISW
jgi:hypothetical protein